MARPHAQAVAGYYPTPDHLVTEIARLVELNSPRWSPPKILDPCAGRGDAALHLARELVTTNEYVDPSLAVIGIEMEKTRAEAARKRLREVHHGDAFEYTFEGGCQVLFLNPPYDHDRDHCRTEHRFLTRFTEALVPGGALLYVVPYRTVAISAEYLASHYEEISVHRFPPADFSAFGQVVVAGRRLGQPVPPSSTRVHRLQAVADDPESLPVLGDPSPEAAPITVSGGYSQLELRHKPLDIPRLLERADPLAPLAPLFGHDRDLGELMGKPLPVALPARPAHIALALAAGLLDGRILHPDPTSLHLKLPAILAKGTFTRELSEVDERRNKDGKITGHICVQQPRLDIHVLTLDTLRFSQLALGTEPTGATEIQSFNTADLLTHYSDSLQKLLAEQLPPIHDPTDPRQQIELPKLARTPYECQEAAIQAGLKLLARGENPQGLAEVGTGKSTVALVLAAALSPEHFEKTAGELQRVGYATHSLRPVRRTLIVCPPHLLDSWKDQAAAVDPEARVQIIDSIPDAHQDAEIYVLSRERAKLGSAVVGVEGRVCPDCGHPLPETSRKKLASTRAVCDVEIFRPRNKAALLFRDLALALYPDLAGGHRELVEPYLRAHPIVHARLKRLSHENLYEIPAIGAPRRAWTRAFEHFRQVATTQILEGDAHDDDYWDPILLAHRIAWILGVEDEFRLRALAAVRSTEVPPAHHRARPTKAELYERLGDGLPTHADPEEALHTILVSFLQLTSWKSEPGCGMPLYCASGRPRRYPLALYIRKYLRDKFDLLILDEVHEFSSRGSAQQKAAHRLVQLPGVPTITLTGSLMGGYASSLFANIWHLSPEFRKRFGWEDLTEFVTQYGYQKILIQYGGSKRTKERVREFGTFSDRAAYQDREDLAVRRLGEAPGILPLYILRWVLPTAMVMHKADLDQELPPCEEVPAPITEDRDTDRKLLGEISRLQRLLTERIRSDRGTERSGALWGAMSKLPSYLDLATEECGPFEVRYPKKHGGGLVATGHMFPSSYKTPKERWLLRTVEDEIESGRRVLVFLANTGNAGFVGRLQRLIVEEVQEPATFLDPARVPTHRRERWLDQVIENGCRVLMVHPRAVQTGLNNLTAFHSAIWYQGPDYDARVTRQANGRPHRIGQTEPVTLYYPYYEGTIQETALQLVGRKVGASEQVDGVSLVGALESAGALSEEDRKHASAALAIGQALYQATMAA